MVKIKFFGAAGTVTGSCYVLEGNATRVMIDFGMFQGAEKISSLNYTDPIVEATKLDAVILTHAHLDHCGRLPLLLRLGYKGKIYMTKPTADLLPITLTDAAHIAEHNPDQIPLFLEEDVPKILEMIQIVDYEQVFTFGEFSCHMIDAGHIIGSASVKISQMQNNSVKEELIFSGDIGNFPQELLKSTEFFDRGHIVVMESTYGGRLHSTEDPSDVIHQEMLQIAHNNGTLLIPSFSIERTQELLHRFDHLGKAGKIPNGLKVYLDSPMAIKVTEVYKKNRNQLNTELQGEFKSDDPFDFPQLVVSETQQDSGKIGKDKNPKVIIAGSGMMTGGRIVKHAKTFLPHTSSRILFVGYQGEETLGREIQEGNKTVFIQGAPVTVNAHVTICNAMSAHADSARLVKWLSAIQSVDQLILTHGDDIPRKDLAKDVQTHLNIHNIHMPMLNEALEF